MWTRIAHHMIINSTFFFFEALSDEKKVPGHRSWLERRNVNLVPGIDS